MDVRMVRPVAGDTVVSSPVGDPGWPWDAWQVMFRVGNVVHLTRPKYYGLYWSSTVDSEVSLETMALEGWRRVKPVRLASFQFPWNRVADVVRVTAVEGEGAVVSVLPWAGTHQGAELGAFWLDNPKDALDAARDVANFVLPSMDLWEPLNSKGTEFGTVTVIGEAQIRMRPNGQYEALIGQPSNLISIGIFPSLESAWNALADELRHTRDRQDAEE